MWLSLKKIEALVISFHCAHLFLIDLSGSCLQFTIYDQVYAPNFYCHLLQLKLVLWAHTVRVQNSTAPLEYAIRKLALYLWCSFYSLCFIIVHGIPYVIFSITLYSYHYQLPHGEPNHSCGGADVWADVGSSSEVFCPAGSYCPTTTQKVNCSTGY